jgi:hypothetical protein
MKSRWIILSIIISLGCILRPGSVQAATLSIGASDTTLSVGDTVTVSVRLSAGGKAINAADGTLIFPSSTLTLQSISRSGSIFTFWAEDPHGSNASSQISFSGGLPSPGYSGSGGKIFQATFKAKAVGSAQLTLSGVHILANDGYGTNVFSGAGSATISIAESGTTPTPPSAPGEPAPVLTLNPFASGNTWYPNNKFSVSWLKPKNYLGSSVVLDQNKGTIPPTTISTTSGTASYTIATDGIWYLHVRHSYSTGWGTTTTATLRHDATAPESFAINVERDRGESDPTPTLSFSAKDATSGIAKYTIVVDDGAPQTISSPYTLKNLSSGAHHVIVAAYDQANNVQTAETTITITGYTAPTIAAVSSPIVLLDAITVRGTANAGDVISLSIDGKILGQTVAGKENPEATKQGITISTPWFFTTDQIVKPGRHEITAVATSIDGRVSVASDPVTLIITGTTIMIGGRPVATIAFAPVAGLFVIIIILLNTALLIRLWLSFRQLYQREVLVEGELETLRRRISRERVTADDVDKELYTMEMELTGRVKRPNPRKTRKKRSA